MAPDLDSWIPAPVVQINQRRSAAVQPARLWAAAQQIQLGDTRALGRLVRLRIPGLSVSVRFDEMFRSPPFNVLEESDGALVSGLVGRIWTLRRDYPVLSDPEEFRTWHARGTVRVLFASWVEPTGADGAVLVNEARVDTVDRRARLGLVALAPLISGSHSLIGSDGLEAAVRRAQTSM